jgi:phenylpyruvate tautomerase PptA (4-oxalocrotonate tautomerase family)
MPVIDLTYPEGALNSEAREQAVERLTAALLKHEGAPDNEQTRAMSRCFIHELPNDAICVGGRPIEQPTYRVVLTVPDGVVVTGAGPLASTARKALVREATEILLEAEGAEYTPVNAGRVFCLIHAVPDGHWGGMGQIFRMEDIVSLASPEWPERTPVAEEAREALAQFTAETGGIPAPSA